MNPSLMSRRMPPGRGGGFNRIEALRWFTILFCSSLLNSTAAQYRSPSIVEHPADVLVGKDQPATLNCHATGRPEPAIKWYKDGKPLNLGAEARHVVLSSGDLFFLQVRQDSTHDDTGTYWCLAHNDVGSVRSNNATLEVAVLGEVFSVMPEDTRVAEGEAAMLECSPPPGSPPPVVTWTKDGRQLDPAAHHRYRVSQSGELVITSSRVGDSGLYSCTARNAFATRTTPNATLTVLVKPHLMSSSGDVTASSGATVELVCRVGGDPPPEVFWTRISPPGAHLPTDRIAQEERGQVLRLRHVSPDDRGVYACTADNPVGYVRANTTLTVNSRPVFTSKPKNARVGVDGVARFECIVTGSPQPTTYWTHEGSGLIVGLGQAWSDGRISVSGDNTLTIVNVREEDTGYYSCVAVGEAGSAIARSYLEVQGVSDMPPPIISIGASNQTLPLGTEAELPCEAKGTPEPIVTWSFNGITLDIENSARHSVSPLGTLRIIRLASDDSGVYTCTASNIAGQTQWQASLAVHKATNPNIRFVKIFWESDLPEPPQNLMVLAINATQVTLGWSRGRSGSSSIRGHRVQYWSPDLRGQWREGTTISPPQHIPTPLATTITNLTPNTRYIFTVRSRNKDFVSRPSAFTRIITTRDTDGHSLTGEDGHDAPPSLKEIRSKLSAPTVRLVSVEALSSSSLRITWRTLVDVVMLEGVYVRYRPLNTDTTNQHMGALSVETIHFPQRGERASDSVDVMGQRQSPSIPTSHTINNLLPASSYEVFVVPFYRSIEGQPTSAMRRTTLPAPVLVTPTGLHYRPINATAVRVSWDPLPATLDVGGRLKGYNVQGLEVSKDHAVIHNTTTNATFVLVSPLKRGITYEFAVRGITSLGLGPASQVLRFTHDEETIAQPIPNSSVPSSTASNNTYMIIAIVCAAILVSTFLLAAIYLIYRRRTLSKCPHYFSSKGDGSSGPWSAYSGCWEDGSTAGGISTTRYNDGTTVTALNSVRYTDGTLTALGNLRYGDMNGSNTGPLYGSENRGQFYATAQDTKSCDALRVAEDLMYEDPEGLRFVSFKGRHNQRCRSPEPYATTPLITNTGVYPRTQQRTDKSINRLPPNIPHMQAMEQNFSSQSDKGSLGSGPVLQFPPPPPPPLSGGESSTSASTNSKGGGSLFLQHLPYHPTGGSSSSHQTSPLLHPRNGKPNPQISPNHSNSTAHQISPRNNKVTASSTASPLTYSHPHDAYLRSTTIGVEPSIGRGGLEEWLNCSGGGLYPPGSGVRCPSPQSSALGDAEESDDKDDSCWSEDNDHEEDGSASECMPSLRPDINWTEAVRLMSEGKWAPGERMEAQNRPQDDGSEDVQEASNKLLQDEQHIEDFYPDMRNNCAAKTRRSTSKDKSLQSSKSSGSKGGGACDGRYNGSHTRNTSLTSPLV